MTGHWSYHGKGKAKHYDRTTNLHKNWAEVTHQIRKDKVRTP